MALDTEYAQKFFKKPRPASFSAIDCVVSSAMSMQGYKNIAAALEYSCPWMTGFVNGKDSLNYEGIIRLLCALDLTVVPKGSDQLMLDQLAAQALERLIAQTFSHTPVGETVMLTDEEFFQLKSLAEYGARSLFAQVARTDHPAQQDAA